MNALDLFLVAIDGSDRSKEAIDLAIRLAKHGGSRLTFCYSIDALWLTSVLEPDEQRCRAALAEAKAAAVAAGLDASTAKLSGRPAGAILDAAKTHGAAAIIMGTHARTGVARAFLGSVAEEVIRRSDRPVFVASTAAPESLARIGVAIDDSKAADAALDFALTLASRLGAKLVLVHVAGDRALERMSLGRLVKDLAKRAATLGVFAEVVVREGGLPGTLLELVGSEKIDLLAIGTHGRGGKAPSALGSVAESVLRESPVPLAVVRRAQAPATRSADQRSKAALMSPKRTGLER